MKSFYSISLRGLCIACMFLFAATAQSAVSGNWTDTGNYADKWEGTGAQNDPYKISTAADLARLSYTTNYGTSPLPDYSGIYFELTADIDLSAHYWMPIKGFAGNLDGGGHSIKNMIIQSRIEFIGIINILTSNGVISNLHVGSDIFVDIHGNLTVQNWIGSIVGINGGIISNCVNTGKITVSQADLLRVSVIIGGIAAINNKTIQNCYSTGKIESSVTSDCIAGGIAGRLGTSNASISNCFSTGTINTDNVWGAVTSGGVLGQASSGSVTNSYFLQEGTINDGLKGVGGAGAQLANGSLSITSSQLKAASFVNTLNGSQSSAPWQADLTNINNGYPILKWQNPSITALPQTTVNTIKFYPNPARNYIELQGTTTILPVKIFDMTGRIMINTQVKPGEKLNISALAKGWYTINIDGQSLKMLKD